MKSYFPKIRNEKLKKEGYFVPAKIELTAEEEMKICEWYQSGLSFSTINKRYGYTQIIARRALVENGIPIRKRTESVKKAQEKKNEEKIRKIKEEQIKKEMNPINCNIEGSKCIYKIKLGNADKICDYLGKTGNMRCCEPEKCTKYILRR